VFVYTIILAFKANNMFGNIKIQFIVCVRSIYFMLKPPVCPKQLRAAPPPVVSMSGELIYLALFT
jgi:hypothetical protein